MTGLDVPDSRAAPPTEISSQPQIQTMELKNLYWPRDKRPKQMKLILIYLDLAQYMKRWYQHVIHIKIMNEMFDIVFFMPSLWSQVCLSHFYSTTQLGQVTFQVFSNRTWLVATMLDRAGLKQQQQKSAPWSEGPEVKQNDSWGGVGVLFQSRWFFMSPLFLFFGFIFVFWRGR